MTSDRPYRRGGSWDAAISEIERAAGSQFDPAVVTHFTASAAKLRRYAA